MNGDEPRKSLTRIFKNAIRKHPEGYEAGIKLAMLAMIDIISEHNNWLLESRIKSDEEHKRRLERARQKRQAKKKHDR